MRERRHAEILAAAAAMIADRGFHVTRLEDIGQAVGISGPGLYRYVSGKEDLLAQILVDISVRLVDGARAVVEAGREQDWPAGRTLRELLNFHVEFAVTDPDRIRVQDREIGNLAPQQREKVRSLQRMYMQMWTDALRGHDPTVSEEEARVRVQLTAGLINSSRYVLRWAGDELVRREAMMVAMKAMDVPDGPVAEDLSYGVIGARGLMTDDAADDDGE